MLVTQSETIIPAPDQRLVTLAQVKREFDIREDDEDIYLESKIDAVSGEISDYCNRIFGAQTYEDTFEIWRCGYVYLPSNKHSRELLLNNWPVVPGSVTITCDGNSVRNSDIVVRWDNGRVTRKPNFFMWGGREVVVQYTAGWALPGWEQTSADIERLPSAVQQAALRMVLSLRQAGRMSWTDRDPYARSESVEGGGSIQYSVAPIGAGRMDPGAIFGGMDADIINRLAQYKVNPRAR